MPGDVDGLHPLRLGQPFGDGKLVALFRPGAREALVFEQKPDDIAMARASPAGKRFYVARREGTEPAPRSAQRACGA